MDPQPTISLCMIVKNESRQLPGCLESARECVDEIVLVDTGSTDDTVAIARRLGARVFSFRWTNDFSAARNESLRHATGDWILYLDADERLLGDSQCLRNAARSSTVDACSVLITSTRTSGDRVERDITYNIRFFRNYPGIHFVNEVHERVEPFLLSKGAKFGPAPFVIEHLGYDLGSEGMQAKHERNLELSRKHLHRTPDDAYALYYLGITLLQMGQTHESEETFQKALKGKSITRGFRAVILNMLAYGCFSRAEYREALEKAEESLEAVPYQDTARLLTGMAHYQLKAYPEALVCLLPSYQFLRLPPERRRTQLSQEHSFLGEAELLKAIAVSYAHTGNPAQAIPFFRRYLEAQPEPEHEMLRLLGMCCLNAQDYLGATRYLGEAVERGADPTRLGLPLAYAFFQRGEMGRAVECLLGADFSHAEDRAKAMQLLRELVDAADRKELVRAIEPLFETLARTFSDSPVLVELLMVLQIKAGRLDRAIETCSRLCRMVPDNPRTLRLLAGLYAKTGDFDKARMTMNQLSRG